MENLFTELNLSPNLTKEHFNALGIHNYWQLLLHIPIRYEDLTKVYKIDQAIVGNQLLIEGEIVSCDVMHKKTRQLIVKISDGSDYLSLVFFHFYPNYQAHYKIGKKIRAFGEIKLGFFGEKSIIHPKIHSVDEEDKLPNTFAPIYSIVQGLRQTTISKQVEYALSCEIPETIPLIILKQYNLKTLAQALTILHKLTPKQFGQKEHVEALKRLKIDELLAQQLILHNNYQIKHQATAFSLRLNQKYTKRLLEQLSFNLTNSQIRVIEEIYSDLAKTTQMNRLLQGDVGSGKTIVATLAMLVAVENGYQACIIAPTEILAEQHFNKTTKLLAPLGIQTIWLSGSLTAKQKQHTYAMIKNSAASIVIGTHAVFQKDVEFNSLALIVIDEQHRFGVEQRFKLQNKGNNPHQLMMSATPIPRTLAMSYYADLDISTIDELPPGRTPIKTLLISNRRKHEVLEYIKQGCEKGHQVYWVCPLIEESEVLDLETVTNLFEELTQKLLHIKIGLIHGKLKTVEKALIMEKFVEGEIQLLVATTVIEVGVDVPNASIMVIEHSERMGLAGLHQLRGRVGRGAVESKCILLYQERLSELAKRRLKVIYENTDGFKISQEDLLIRGPGELLGNRQSGLPILKFADLEVDWELFKLAKVIANNMLKEFNSNVREHIELWFKAEQNLIKI